MSFHIDRHAEQEKLRAYSRSAIGRVLREAAAAGAKAALTVLRSKAPVGTAARLSEYYRHKGLEHGALRDSLRAAPIRTRGSQIGEVVAPMGTGAFARAFVELRTHWMSESASAARSVAYRASDAVLSLYARAK